MDRSILKDPYPFLEKFKTKSQFEQWCLGKAVGDLDDLRRCLEKIEYYDHCAVLRDEIKRREEYL